MEFPEEQRHIFRYFNGEAHVFGDPLAINRQLTVRLIDPSKCVQTINASEQATDPLVTQQGWAATEALVDAVREVFKLTPFDQRTGKGATEMQAIALVRRFWDFMDGLKKNGVSSPTSPVSTVSTSADSPTSSMSGSP